MKRTTNIAVAAGLALTVMASMRTSLAASNDVNETTVQLVSQTTAAGSATLSKTKDGVLVKVTTVGSPSSNQIAEIRRGSCASRGMQSGAAPMSGSTNSTTKAGATAGTNVNTGVPTSSNMSAPGTGAASSSTDATTKAGATSGTNVNTGARTSGNMSAEMYSIGPVMAAQGSQGGQAQTTIKNVALTDLLTGGYSIAILNSTAGSAQSNGICGDIAPK